MNKKLLFSAALLPLVSAPIALVASCSDSTNNDGVKALNNIDEMLSKVFSLYLDKTVSEFKTEMIPVLDPSENYGFTTTVTGLEIVNASKGELAVKVNIHRGTEKYDNTYKFQGLLTKAQKEADKTIKPEDKFDVAGDGKILSLVTKNKDENIDKFISDVNDSKLDDAKKMEKITTLVNLNSTASSPFVKEKQPDGILKNGVSIDGTKEKLKVVEVKPWKEFDVTTKIEVKLQIATLEKEADSENLKEKEVSSTYTLFITGFDEINKNVETDSFLKNYADKYFSSVASPVNPAEAQKETEIKDLNTKEALEKKLKKVTSKNDDVDYMINGQKITWTLKDIVKDSHNKSLGSLRAKFDFKVGSKELKDQEVTLYGFKLK